MKLRDANIDRESFFERLKRRRASDSAHYDQKLGAVGRVSESEPGLMEATALTRELALETIVSEERPVLFVKDGKIDLADARIDGLEAKELVEKVGSQRKLLEGLLPLIGRIDVTNLGSAEYIGTGWFIDDTIVVTNRHVAEIVAVPQGRKFVFRQGARDETVAVSLNTAHEYADDPPESNRVFDVVEVIHIAPKSTGHDLALLRVSRPNEATGRRRIDIATNDLDERQVCTIGYPARAPASVIHDQDEMHSLFRGKYGVKRVAPGFGVKTVGDESEHDCSTLGGNSGSVVVDLTTGEAVGLHFAGVYHQANYAVRAAVLRDYAAGKFPETPLEVRTPHAIASRAPHAAHTAATTAKRSAPQIPMSVAADRPATATWTGSFPIEITVRVGSPTMSPPAASPSATTLPSALVGSKRPRRPLTEIEQAVESFWHTRPEGVLAARVGYVDDGDRIGDTPCIAAFVLPSRLATLASAGPTAHAGFSVRWEPASAMDQLDATVVTPEAAIEDGPAPISYDDDARTDAMFSLDPIEEPMKLRLSVGPESSWDELRTFLADAKRELVSAIYEFHADHIREALEARLEAGVPLTLVADSQTWARHRKDTTGKFDAERAFAAWSDRFGDAFARVVTPEGPNGLIKNAYHIKVSVRDQSTFWLSSGNWKPRSSQPIITPDQRAAINTRDLDGNREWHVVGRSNTLAERFRNHILQDFACSEALGGGILPKSRIRKAELAEIEILEESVVLERAAPSRLLPPREIEGLIRVQPLLTPDRRGAVYTGAVLALIRSARESLLFQIPYIRAPKAPGDDRGFLDDLVDALVERMSVVPDARIILRNQGSGMESPAHMAWFLKSKGVNIDQQVRRLDDTHTKGLVVDGRRVLVGSHNWSADGVTLNRDASLIIDHRDAAAYYTEAFNIDWKRALRITPKRVVAESALATAAELTPRILRVAATSVLDD